MVGLHCYSGHHHRETDINQTEEIQNEPILHNYLVAEKVQYFHGERKKMSGRRVHSHVGSSAPFRCGNRPTSLNSAFFGKCHPVFERRASCVRRTAEGTEFFAQYAN